MFLLSEFLFALLDQPVVFLCHGIAIVVAVKPLTLEDDCTTEAGPYPLQYTAAVRALPRPFGHLVESG